MRFVAVLGLFLSATVFAGQSGYIKDGKTYIVYKEGEKVGEWPKDLNNDITTRLPGGYISFEEDDMARCYFGVTRGNLEVTTLDCIEKHGSKSAKDAKKK